MTGSAPSSDFGRYLQQMRRTKEIPLETVSQVTKIRLVVLQLIENEDLTALPTPTLTKGFLRAYADAVGADRAEILKRYDAALREHAAKTMFQTPQVAPRPVWRHLLLAIVLIIVLIALSLYLMERPKHSDIHSPAQMPAPTESPPPSSVDHASPNIAPAAPSPPQESGEAQGVPSPSDAAIEPEDEAATDSDASQNEALEGITVPEPENMPPDNAIEDIAPEQTAPPPNAPDEDRRAVIDEQRPEQTDEALPVSEAHAKKKVLEVSAIELTWLEVTTDEEAPRELMLRPDHKVIFEAQDQFHLVIGNAAGIRLTLDGEPIEVPGKSGKVVRLTLP